ncbi:hypothetical protein JHK85_043884 [Glycine max]|nr:hypothetical protein JHK85_043884 [Glycine max]
MSSVIYIPKDFNCKDHTDVAPPHGVTQLKSALLPHPQSLTATLRDGGSTSDSLSLSQDPHPRPRALTLLFRFQTPTSASHLQLDFEPHHQSLTASLYGSASSSSSPSHQTHDDDLFDEDSIVKATSSNGASNVVDVD